MNTTTLNSEFKRYREIEHRVDHIYDRIKDDDRHGFIESMIDLAGVISTQDMEGYVTRNDLAEVRISLEHKIELLRKDVEYLGDKIITRLTYIVLGAGGLTALLIKLPEIINAIKELGQ